MKTCALCGAEFEDLRHSCPKCGSTAFSMDMSTAGEVLQRQTKAAELVTRGDQLGRAGKYVEAEQVLREAIEINPFNETAYGNLGGVFYFQGRYAEAIPWLEKALEINPAIEGVPEALARAKAEVKKAEEEVRASRTPKPLGASEQRPSMQDMLNAALTGEFDRAEQILDSGLGIDERIVIHDGKTGPQLEVTALHIAVMMGRLEVVRFFLDNGADPKAKNGRGETCVEVAKNPEVKKLLTEAISGRRAENGAATAAGTKARSDPAAETPPISQAPADSSEPYVSFSCSCGKRLRAKQRKDSAKYKCPACGNTVSVPGQKAEEPPKQVPSVSGSPAVPAPTNVASPKPVVPKESLASLVKLAAADEYHQAWKDLANAAVSDDVVDLFMAAFRKGEMKWGSINKLSRFLRDINATASPDALFQIVERHRHKPNDSSETHLLGKAAANLLLLPQGLGKLRQCLPADARPWVIAQGLLGCEEIEDSVKIGSSLTDPGERQSILQHVMSASVTYSSFRARALAGLAPESIDLIRRMYSPESEEAGGIGAALFYAVGGADELKKLMGEAAFETIVVGAHAYGIGTEPIMQALSGLGTPKAIERLTHALLNNDDRAIAPLVSLGKKAHPTLLEDLRRSWQRNVDALVVYKRRILRVLSESGDEDCVPAIRDAARLHPELKMECEKLVRKLQGSEEKHAQELAAAGDIHTAAGEGDLATVKLILEQNPALANAMKAGSSPLHAALDTNAGHLDIAKLLIAHGANVTLPNGNGVTPLHLNSLTGNCEIAELLISRGARIDATNPNDGSTPLHLASMQGKTDLVAFLLSKGANVNAREKKYGIAAIQFAAVNGHTQTLEYLLSHGADPAIRDSQGRTPAELAAQQNRPESVAVLRKYTEKQATVQQETLNNELFAAVAAGNAREVKALLDRGANANAKERDGNTPLHKAAYDKEKKLDCCRALLEKGADANAKNDRGHTPLEHVLDFELRFRASMQAAFGGFGASMASGVGNEQLMPLLTLFKQHGAKKPANMDSASWNAVPGGKAAGCFIATACCGSEDCWQVSALRQFRDERLLSNGFGRGLVAAYYRLSPPLARLLGKMPFTRLVVRCFAITPLSYVIAQVIHTPDRRSESVAISPKCRHKASAGTMHPNSTNERR